MTHSMAVIYKNLALQCCRVAGNAAENEMDANALALSLAPCIAWHPPPQSERRRVHCHSCFIPILILNRHAAPCVDTLLQYDMKQAAAVILRSCRACLVA